MKYAYPYAPVCVIPPLSGFINWFLVNCIYNLRIFSHLRQDFLTKYSLVLLKAIKKCHKLVLTLKNAGNFFRLFTAGSR